MTDTFNHPLSNMLGSLNSEKKVDWNLEGTCYAHSNNLLSDAGLTLAQH